MASMEDRLQVLYSLPLTTAEHKEKKPKLELVTEAIGDIKLSNKMALKPANGVIVTDSPTDAALRLFKTGKNIDF